MRRGLGSILIGLLSFLRGFLSLFAEILAVLSRILWFVGKIFFFLGALAVLLTAVNRYLRKVQRKKRAALVFILIPFLSAQARAEEGNIPPLKRVDAAEITLPFVDHAAKESFRLAVTRQLENWKFLGKERAQKPLAAFPDRPVTLHNLRESLQALDQLFSGIQNPRFLDQAIRNRFDFYQMTGKTGVGDVLLTAYYHPEIPGSLVKTREFPYPLYRRPDDLIAINLGNFREQFQGIQLLGRVDNRNFLPYFDRRQIDYEQKLSNRHLELAYVASDLDRFFLQIQGSGTLVLPDGSKMPVHYEAANGQKYVSIGPEIAKDDLLRREELSMQNIRDLLSYDQKLKDEYLSRNPSYVFFKKGSGEPRGSAGAVLTPLRSVATDKKIYPAGAPVFIRFRKPTFSSEGKIDQWIGSSAFMIDQDTGGAIKGSGRVDLYLGAGKDAEEIAGNLAHYGAVYYLVLKSGL